MPPNKTPQPIPNRLARSINGTIRQNVWLAEIEELAFGQRIRIHREGCILSFRDVFGLLESDPRFARWYTSVLSESKFESFFWEHPPLTTGLFDGAAEFVLIEGRSLSEQRPDPQPFRRQFEQHPDDDVITFPNLRGDALLVVPRPAGALEAYTHLASFVRSAPADQIETLWQKTGRLMRECITSDPRWLSTAGMGVSWLHIRLDSSPKYYRFGPYKTVT